MVTEPGHNERVFVFAGNYGEYLQWLRATGHTPRTAVYVRDRWMLMGVWGITVVRVGTYFRRSDVLAVERELGVVQARVVWEADYVAAR